MPRASRRRGEAARRHADTLRFVLFEARPAGLLFQQLVRASDLSPSQVRAGLACLRDIIAENGWPPLIWTRTDGYQLGAEPAALQAYERAVLAEKLTEFRRFLTGTVAPHAAAHPRDKWVKHIIAQLNSIESTLDLVVSS
ncbi:RacP protein [Streptomyces sp. NPDC005962]|uniref:RacP protein n=1 Tax=Streptomyces sp. NPDC005962 TaxID=3154466 RepID=UPI003405B1DF